MYIIRNENINSKIIDGSWYLLEKNKKTVRRLNSVAGYCWKYFEKAGKLDDLIVNVCKRYKIDLQTAKIDIESFVKEYVRDGYLLEVKTKN